MKMRFIIPLFFIIFCFSAQRTLICSEIFNESYLEDNSQNKGVLLYKEGKSYEAAVWYIEQVSLKNQQACDYVLALNIEKLDEMTREEQIRSLQSVLEARIQLDGKVQEGLKAYTEGDFKTAGTLLASACEEGEGLAQRLYADICYRQLDGDPHSLMEAALWYILSAEGGDAESRAFLMDEFPGIFDIKDANEQIRSLVKVWVIEETLPLLKPLKPSDINDYLVYRFDRPIDKTTSQKLPYFFDKSMAAITYSLTGFSRDVFEEEQLIPIHDSQELRSDRVMGTMGCRTQKIDSKISQKVFPLVYGPIYSQYLNQLEKNKAEVFASGILKKSLTKPKTHFIYGVLLDVLYEITKEYKANDFVKLTHRDYPWILAGIRLWEHKNKQKITTASYENQYIIDCLRHMDKDIFGQENESDLSEILEKIESEDVWNKKGKTDQEYDSIISQFSENVRAFFSTPLSRDDRLIQDIQRDFFEKIDALNSLIIDFSNPGDLEILETPFLMFACKDLKLNGVKIIKKHFEYLMKVQRYFVDLERLTVTYSNPPKKNKSLEGKIKNLMEVIAQRGVDVS